MLITIFIIYYWNYNIYIDNATLGNKWSNKKIIYFNTQLTARDARLSLIWPLFLLCRGVFYAIELCISILLYIIKFFKLLIIGDRWS